ncbi:G-type lectin S-receptor-like serine/threonine-protein kinase SD2-5 [Gossypium arboreum]|nr:G-type lectin S-receptor-like serine/threonine-protein kinase SD2-5 [Gossypium arboreum]
MLGMPTRFSYEELKNITKNFSNKLGEGGFGSVFHGILPLGSGVAVKHQFNFGAVNKSFIAEVQTIGSIHHFNLVSLVGFCAESSNRLLVYEYMANGSLDRWIFNQNRDLALDWQIRRKIILDIAKGLAYLHEECNQKIIHLDIKPQNILLDENFNAKISDFGLSKLIEKDQSRVITTMRGTPGYMAPEWLNLCITEKVDVYSFGIVVLEILCGRRNVDESQQEEDMHLLGLFKRKQEEGQLMDLVDKCSDDMQSNAAEVVEVMKVAAWCLQTEYARRPSMSTVVKLFEDSVDVTGSLNEDFLNGITLEPVDTFPSIVLPSMLSGPR